MEKAWSILIFLVMSSAAFADKRVTLFADRVDRRTGEPYISFYAGEYQRGVFFNLHNGLGTRKAKWVYHISVRGSGAEFLADQISVRKRALPALEEVTLIGGGLKIDRDKRTITLALKVRVGDKIEEFEGNGTYQWERNEP